MKNSNKHLPLITKRMTEHNLLEYFRDVVKFNKWQNICSTRFTKGVKQFWSVNLHLFHAKFMRFMGVGLLYGDSNMTTWESSHRYIDSNRRSMLCTDKDNQTDFVTLSSKLCYTIINILLPYHQDLITLLTRLCYSSHYYHHVCFTHFYRKI